MTKQLQRTKSGEIKANSVVEYTGVIIYADVFECAVCGQQWDRGGKKEGFVKKAAFDHGFSCWQVQLFERGFVLYDHGHEGRTVRPITDTDESVVYNVARMRRYIAGRKRIAAKGKTPHGIRVP